MYSGFLHHKQFASYVLALMGHKKVAINENQNECMAE